MNSNLALAQKVIAKLLDRGIDHFVVCAGSFNSPFVAVLALASNIKVYNHFEERGAAFFALGLCKQLGKPVAVCVTSGTAVAECLPAVIEAAHDLKALVVLSADREEKLSGCGYPQAINQSGLLSSHAQYRIDITEAEDLDCLPADIDGPLHCNVRFLEPVLELPLKFTAAQDLLTPRNIYPATELQRKDFISAFLINFERPLVIIENIPLTQRGPVREFLLRLGAPILAESRSGLKEDTQLAKFILKTQEFVLTNPVFDCVLRIGSVPSSDLWRSLERDDRFNRIPVCSISPKGQFRGLSRDSLCHPLEEESFESTYTVKDSDWVSSLFELDQRLNAEIKALLASYPLSEPALVNWFSKQVSTSAFLYLGNSLPIREWNQFADRADRKLLVDANRGANGIDGQIASFLGAAVTAGRSRNFSLIGDLTFLYDCNSLGLLSQLPDLNFCLGLIQNRGGKIFEKLPYFKELLKTEQGKSSFLNQHTIDCMGIAQAFGLQTLRVKEPMILKDLPEQVVMEIVPSEEETMAFWQEHAKLRSH